MQCKSLKKQNRNKVTVGIPLKPLNKNSMGQLSDLIFDLREYTSHDT